MGSPTAEKTKSQRNRKYKRNEASIQKAIFKLIKIHRGRITAKQIIKETHVSRQTVYVHYPDLANAPDEIENQIIVEFLNEIDVQINTLSNFMKNHNTKIFYSVFLFMAKRKDLFIQVCGNINNQNILYRMMAILYPRIKITWFPLNSPSPKIGSEQADMYMSMAVEIIRKWGLKTKCNIYKSSRYINRLQKLTEEASSRCK